MLLGIGAVAALVRPVGLSAQFKTNYRQVVVQTGMQNITTSATTFPFNPTALAIGPHDGKLYFAVADGRIFSVIVQGDLTVPQNNTTTVYTALQGRLVMGLAFGPNNDLFVSHSDGRVYDAAIPPGTGKVTRLYAPNYNTSLDIVTGLPRSRRDHGPNQLTYHNGYLYLAQAGMTNAGLTRAWVPGEPHGNILWDIPESYYSASIILINPNLVNSYQIYARGLRNPFKMLFHSNGAKYSNDNGPNPGAGDQTIGGGNCNSAGDPPASGDRLVQITMDGYHGHPNPVRLNGYYWNECDFNPAAGRILTYGAHTSANGIDEYRTPSVPTAIDALTGHIFSAHYVTGEITSVRMVGTSQIGMGPRYTGFANPLDILISHLGNIFITEFAGMGTPGVVSVLRPMRTVPVDFDNADNITNPVPGSRRSDLTIYRPSTNTWHTWSQTAPGGPGLRPGVVQGSSGVVPRPGDIDGDGKADPVTWHPTTGIWTLPHSAWGFTTTVQHGSPGDIALSADVDGDTRADQVIWRPSNGTWYVRYANTGVTISYQWGANGDIPRVMDIDADGKADLTVYRPSNSTWYILPYGSIYNPFNPATHVAVQFGSPGDIPVPADYDGDGRTDIAQFRPSTAQWFILPATANYNVSLRWEVQFGQNGDQPRPLDWDGDGKHDVALWRPSDGTWYITLAANGFSGPVSSVWHGGWGDIPVDPVIQ